MTVYQDRHGIVDIGAHRDYMEEISREDEKLERTLTNIRARTDTGQLSTAEAAAERVKCLESHLAECQRLRRVYLGGQ